MSEPTQGQLASMIKIKQASAKAFLAEVEAKRQAERSFAIAEFIDGLFSAETKKALKKKAKGITLEDYIKAALAEKLKADGYIKG